jgi:Arc/MetJ family transcription regulator
VYNLGIFEDMADVTKEKVMAKMNISIDEEVREELFRLVPPRRRSQVVNEALRKELAKRTAASQAGASDQETTGVAQKKCNIE